MLRNGLVWGGVFIFTTTVLATTGTWFFLIHDRFYDQPYLLFFYIFGAITWASLGGPACVRLMVDNDD